MPIPAQHIKAARLHLQKSDPIMKRIVRHVGPCLLKTKSDRFRTLVDSIISQQISGLAATTICNRLVTDLQPDKISPETLLGYQVDQLRELGISRQKASYLLDLARKVHEKQLDLNSFTKLEDEQIITELTKVKGIGRWTAQMFLMFCLGRLDVFPVDDLGIQNAIRKHYCLTDGLNAHELNEIAVPWRPYATIASWYLWQSLEQDE